MSMNKQRPISIIMPATYRIEFFGALERAWEGTFGDLHIAHRPGRDGTIITTLTGEVPDQAALAGVLNLAFSLGLPLLSVEYIEDAALA